MKIFPHNFFLRNENNDSGDASGGGNTKVSGDNKQSDNDTNDANGPEGDRIDDSDIDVYNTYQRRIGGRTTNGKPNQGTLEKALEDSLGGGAGKGNEDTKDGDNREEEDGDQKGTGQKEDKLKAGDKKGIDKKDDEEEDGVLGIDPTTLKSKSGAPITNEAQENFNKLKGYAKKYKQELTELKAKMSQSTENSKPAAEVEAMEKELIELRQRVDIEQFESSAGFVETYQKPMEDAKTAVAKFFPKTMEADDVVKLTQAFKEAHAAVIADDEVEFYRIVDEITDELVTGGTSMKNAFAGKMATYYEKLKNFADAKANKSEDRKQFVEKNMQSVRSKNSKSVETAVDDYVNRLLVDKADLLDGIPPEQKEKYVKSINDNKTIVKNHLAKMTMTGEVSSELSGIIQRGVSYDSLYQENSILSDGFRDAARKVRILEEENAKLKAARKSNSSSNNSQRYPERRREDQSTEKNGRREGEGAIEYSMRKQREEAMA